MNYFISVLCHFYLSPKQTAQKIQVSVYFRKSELGFSCFFILEQRKIGILNHMEINFKAHLKAKSAGKKSISFLQVFLSIFIYIWICSQRQALKVIQVSFVDGKGRGGVWGIEGQNKADFIAFL